MKYKVAIKLGDSYSKDRRGYLASARIRGHWLAKYWPECDDFFYPEEFPEYKGDFFNPVNQFHILEKYDVVILNKTYEWKLAKALHFRGIKIIVDFCDPDFLLSHSSEQRVNDCLETLKYTDLVVVNGKTLKKYLKKFYKGRIEIVPDRIDLDSIKKQKTEHNESFDKIVWYGYNENLRILEPYLKRIIEMGLEITIISDKFFENFIMVGCKYDPKKRITFKVFHPELFNEQVIEHDAVFIGEDKDKYLSKFKSPNRALNAWAMKMPVAFNLKDLKFFKDKKMRVWDANEGYKFVKKYADIKQSVKEYVIIVQGLLNRRCI